MTDDEEAGIAALVLGLVRQNLERDPARRRLLRGGSAVIAATDAGTAVRVELVPDLPWVEGWPLEASVEVRTTSATLLELSAAPLRFGLPDVLSRDGRRLVVAILGGSIRIRGLMRHLPTVRRLTMLLSAR